MNERKLLEKHAISAISRYYSPVKVKSKVKELLASSNGKMQNNQGGSSKWYNKYYQFYIDGTDVYHRVVYQSGWSPDSCFNKDNKHLWVKWSKN